MIGSMWSHQNPNYSDELCLIDSGITSMRDLPLSDCLRTLNLHCNSLVQIENLHHLRNLRHLDLSSNQITEIHGLEGLISLRNLNLSCNLITKVDGLQNLRCLVKLNLSYNSIEDLSGLQNIRDGTFKLSHIDLHGNHIASLGHVTRCLVACANLRSLSLSQNGADNSCCHKPEYRRTILSGLPQLEILDGQDRDGRMATHPVILADIPGLDDYLEFLVSDSSLTRKKLSLATPKIDAALELFRRHPESTQEGTTDHESSRGRDTWGHNLSLGTASTFEGSEHLSEDHENRIALLENQLVKMLEAKSPRKEKSNLVSSAASPNRSKIKTPRSRKKPSRSDASEDSESETVTSVNLSRIKKAKTPEKWRTPSSSTPSSATRAAKGNSASSAKKSNRNDDLEVAGRNISSIAAPQRTPGFIDASNISTTAADEVMRNEMQNTYVELMKDLEKERERRWKSEQVAKKLVDHVQAMKSQMTEGKEVQDIAVEATGRLKQALTNEREAKVRLQAEVEILKEELQKANERTEVKERDVENLQRALKVTEDTLGKTSIERSQQLAHEHKKIQEAQARASAGKREVEILSSQVKTLKSQVQSLQELLVNREQEHRKDLDSRYKLGSREFLDAVQKEVEKIEKFHAEQLRGERHKVDSLSKQYSELEDEFRMALTYEANRFAELQRSFEEVSQDNSLNKQALMVAQRKDEKSTSVISELTALVKEQKGRITELSKSKQEQIKEYKERVDTLEIHLDEARRRMIQFEMLKQEKIKNDAQMQAQESMIQGLKGERKLWEEELAQQGSSLAADRGRLESKIEALQSEISHLQKLLNRETDAVKIKTKLIEDQTETIRKLREAVIERDTEIKKCRDESLRIQKEHEQQMETETVTNQALQESLDRNRERKEELKGRVEELEEHLEQANKAHSILHNKWKEKSNSISDLEKQVLSLKGQWEAKEKRLQEERDKAVQAASLAIEKIRSMDDAFRKQLESKEDSHQRELASLEEEKEEEVALANKRVLEVEEEMRELLKESALQKRQLEEKLKRVNQAFSDLQSEVF